MTTTSTTKERLLRLVTEGNTSQVDLARRLGVSRQYINQLKNTLGLQLSIKSKWKKYCTDCGKEIEGYHRCRNCYMASHRVSITCMICGITFTLPRGKYKRALVNRKTDGFFCSKRCFGRYFGLNYGVHNLKKARKSGALRKWDYDEVWKYCDNHSMIEVSKMLVIPYKSVYDIVKKRRQGGSNI